MKQSNNFSNLGLCIGMFYNEALVNFFFQAFFSDRRSFGGFPVFEASFNLGMKGFQLTLVGRLFRWMISAFSFELKINF